jgi:hypothetical protein
MGRGIAALPLVASVLAAGLSAASLSNDRVSAEVGEHGLTVLRGARATYHFSRDDFRVVLSGVTYDSASLPAPERRETDTSQVLIYQAGPYRIAVLYELRPDWHFVSKRLSIESSLPTPFTIDEIALFRNTLREEIENVHVIAPARPNLGTGDYGAALRFPKSRGLLVSAQNPFLAFHRDAADFSLTYKPEMQWNPKWGVFETDRGLLAPYELSGETIPAKMQPEWTLDPADETAGMDTAEVDAFTEMVRAFLLYKPIDPLNIMVGWCANDYQIDIATPEGRTEYKRILDMAAQVGAEHVLFAPANSELSRRSMSRDDWKWEYVLWLGLGQKIRRDEWLPASSPIPASLQEMLDYARGRNLKLVAYVYPILPFEQNRDWLVDAGGKQRANLGIHEWQDFLVVTLEAFLRRTGISGYSFDHTFLNLPGASRYAQWFGWRRVMETLRRDIPDIVIDGRQAYQNYGPWSWLAGSYPHPTSTDEQPESFVSFPDLKIDRVSADRQRYTAYRYREYEFAPSEIMPGFITHQTPRNGDTGSMPSRKTDVDEVVLPFRQRDWDYLGWRYSLISSIATAGWNNVIDMIPARDPAEFEHFSDDDRDWFRHWIDWTDVNKEYLRKARPILGQPAVGKVDGMAAFVRDRGYVFLFNPNGRRMPASFTLDESIGLTEGNRFTVRELYPVEDRLIGKPGTAVWSAGDEVSRDLDGGSAMVLEIEPDERTDEAKLYNSAGEARVDGTTVKLTGVRGEAGMTEVLQVRAPSPAKIKAVEIAGKTLPAQANRSGVIEIPVTFAGARFHHYQQLDADRPGFTGGTVSATFRVPQRVFDQLAARRKAWPIPWTEEDLRSTWLAPERLLLYVQLAEPDDRWTASLTIDGKPVELKKGYASVRVNRRNFVGFYADLSAIAPDAEHRLELTLPEGLKPGQYQGVFFENVETEYTRPVVK